jgi:hypothetical protein
MESADPFVADQYVGHGFRGFVEVEPLAFLIIFAPQGAEMDGIHFVHEVYRQIKVLRQKIIFLQIFWRNS